MEMQNMTLCSPSGGFFWPSNENALNVLMMRGLKTTGESSILHSSLRRRMKRSMWSGWMKRMRFGWLSLRELMDKVRAMLVFHSLCLWEYTRWFH